MTDAALRAESPAPKLIPAPTRPRALRAVESPDRGPRVDERHVVAPRAIVPSATPGRSRVRSLSERTLEKLWKAYRRHPDDETRNRLVEHYQPFMSECVRRFASRLPRCVDRGDLATAANVGLMSAIGGFDPKRGVRFEAYCELRVKGALIDELRNMDWLPRPWRARLELQKRTTERLRAEANREPSDEEVAGAMEMPLEEYRLIFGLGHLDVPLGASAEGDAEGGPLLEIVPDTNSDAPGEKLSRDEILRLVAQRLTGQEYRLVYLKYWEELSMREIGELMRISESRVCKIHMRLLERLKDRFRVGADD